MSWRDDHKHIALGSGSRQFHRGQHVLDFPSQVRPDDGRFLIDRTAITEHDLTVVIGQLVQQVQGFAVDRRTADVNRPRTAAFLKREGSVVAIAAEYDGAGWLEAMAAQEIHSPFIRNLNMGNTGTSTGTGTATGARHAKLIDLDHNTSQKKQGESGCQNSLPKFHDGLR